MIKDQELQNAKINVADKTINSSFAPFIEGKFSKGAGLSAAFEVY